ncbi:MAG: hypothetical protein HC771_03180 [Synechococcales cyanobacterium CRU_2_2]|nr:hypothetical protein [Synechococcales cyanobacterium CRU_2_2]
MVASLNRRGTDDQVSVVQALAKLVSHRVPLDLMPLYGDVDAPEPKRVMVKTVPLGGAAIAKTILSEANRAQFKDVRVERAPQQNVLLEPQPESEPESEPEPQPESKPEPDERRFVPTAWLDPATTTVDDRLLDSQIALSQAHAAFLENRKAALKRCVTC